MAALRSLEDERAEMQRELDSLLSDRSLYAQKRAQIVLEGEPADSPWLRKIGWQLDACDRSIVRITANLQEGTA